MKAWQLDKLGGHLSLVDLPIPEARPGTVLVRTDASVLMSYMKPYVEGKLPIYHAPAHPFTPGGSGVGVVSAVGQDVWHVKPGQRVVVSSHIVANENVPEPGQFLLGITAMGPVAEAMQADHPNGLLAEYVLVPATIVTAADGLEAIDAPTLAATMRFVVPYGGFLRGRLVAGETVVVSGATGAYGSAAVLLAVALGASRVVAAARNAESLAALAVLAGPRVVPVALSGNLEKDVPALRAAALGGAHLALDLVGSARDANATLAAMKSLQRRGRLVLMGSMTVPLPLSYGEMMMNDLEILGNFMYPQNSYLRLLGLIRSGQLDPRVIQAQTFAFDDLPRAIDAALEAKGLECVVITRS